MPLIAAVFCATTLLSAKFGDFLTQPSNRSKIVGLFDVGHLVAG